MKSPWDKEPKTAVIKSDEVTEHFSLDDFLKAQKVAKAPAPKPAAPPPEPKTAPATVKKEAAAPMKPAEPAEAAPALDEELSESVGSDDLTAPRNKNVGEILIRMTKLTREQLDEALSSQQENPTGERLGEILVRKKYITDVDLLRALSLQLNIPIFEHLNKEHLDADLVTKIPINFAKKYGLIPVRKERGHMIVAISNAVDLSPMDDLRILLQMDVKPVLANRREILDAINRVYDRATKSSDDLIEDLEEPRLDDVNLEETQDLLDSEDEAPIIRLVNTLLFRAVKERASDIHIEPFEKDLSVRFRIDGILYEIMKPPKRAQASITSRVKIMAQMDIAEKRLPQDGRIKIKLAGRDVDIRVSTLPTSFGESIVLRLLDTSNVILDLEEIGFSQKQLQMVNQIISQPHGMFLVTGPTGSGKTTTLYSCLARINSRELKIITVENPVEIQLHGVNQIPVNEKIGLTFSEGLKSILRQDPDVIMVGEIRDLPTARIAVEASLTGHLVFSTLHTNHAADCVTRMVQMGVESYLVSDCLLGVMAQRLIRVVCKSCRQPYQPPPEELEQLGVPAEEAKSATFFRSKGCPACYNTGFRGRTGIYEILMVDDELKTLIVKNADGSIIKKSAVARGMKTLREDGVEKAMAGITTVEEILRATQDELTIG